MPSIDRGYEYAKEIRSAKKPRYSKLHSQLPFLSYAHEHGGDEDSCVFHIRYKSLQSCHFSTILTWTDLKNTTDDALPNYLTSLKFKQSHFFTDVRLALGYSAVVIAATTFYADYKLGWDKTKFWTCWAVLVYFFLNGALTFWIWGVEKGIVFAGEVDHPSVGRKSV